MTDYEKSLEILMDLFGHDCQFALATSQDNVPSVRVIDTYFQGRDVWIVTYGKSNKAIEMTENPNVALCSFLYSFKGLACNMGHPLKEENKAIREILIREFEPWYFAHNNENDESMCYFKVELTAGFFFQHGLGYRVNFSEKTAETFPFEPDTLLQSYESH